MELDNEESKIITLNVGGVLMQTHEDTLINNSIYFKNIIKNFKYDKDKPIFIDDDPENFKHILNFMRNNKYRIPTHLEHMVDWYGVAKIEHLISEPLLPEIKKDNLTNKKYNIEDNSNYSHQGALINIVATARADDNPTENSCLVKKLILQTIAKNRSATTESFYKLNKSDKFNGWNIEFNQECDLITNLTLFIKLKEPSIFDIKIFKSLIYTLNICEPSVMERDFLQIYDELFVSAEKKQYRENMANNGFFVYDLPTCWRYSGSLNMFAHMMTGSNYSLDIELCNMIDYEEVFLIRDNVFLDSDERRIVTPNYNEVLNTKIMKQLNPWYSDSYEFSYDGDNFILSKDLKINHCAKSFIIVVEDENCIDIPIKNMEILVCSNNVLKYFSGSVMKYLMFRDYKINTSKNYYYYECKNGENINFQRLQNSKIKLWFYKNMSKGNYKLKIFYECQYV